MKLKQNGKSGIFSGLMEGVQKHWEDQGVGSERFGLIEFIRKTEAGSLMHTLILAQTGRELD